MKTKHILLPLVALFVSATSFASNDCGVFADACAHGAKLAAKNQATIQKSYDKGYDKGYNEGRQARIEAIRAKAREQARLEYEQKLKAQQAANEMK